MKILTKKNFIEFLVKNKACQPGLDWAQSQVSARDIVEKCLEGQYLCWLIGAIGGPMLAEYEEKRAPLWAEYEEKRAPLWAKYLEKRDPLWAEYEEKVAQLLAEYDEKRDPIRAEYEEKRYALWGEYCKKCNSLAKEICTFERVQAEIGD